MKQRFRTRFGLHGKRIYQDGRLYLTRYYLWGDGSGKGYELYLHRIHGPDPDRAPHNHPWPWFLSIVLWGWYFERRITLRDTEASGVGTVRMVRWFNYMPTRGVFHRIIEAAPHGAWTLVLCPPKAGTWGYAVRGKFEQYNGRHARQHGAFAEDF